MTTGDFVSRAKDLLNRSRARRGAEPADARGYDEEWYRTAADFDLDGDDGGYLDGEHPGVPGIELPGERGPSPASRVAGGCLWLLVLPFRLIYSFFKWLAIGTGVLLLITILWLAATKPIEKTLEPHGDPYVLVSQNGEAIARGGDVVLAPVEAELLPDHVKNAFIATEDRRFYSHWGIDPIGIARAFVSNLFTGSRQGGSTITMQLAKVTYFDFDQTMGRKLLEVPTALWLETWLTKDEILERYLSKIYFGDRSYGLRAASLRYFDKAPEALTPAEAMVLAGLPKAPSNYAPSFHPEAALKRARVVKGAMVDAGYLSQAQADAIPTATFHLQRERELPRYAHFTNWIRKEARAQGYDADARIIPTTLDVSIQRAAEAAVKSVNVGNAQVALVAMRPDGAVLAMVGSKDYNTNQFNHALAGRQPGSTFKIFVWLAALENGMTPDTLVSDTPMQAGPRNAGEKYRGEITLQEAFAHSSNVVATRLYEKVGGSEVVDLANKFGIAAQMDPNDTSIPLGTADVSLLELTAAYAGVARGEYPVVPYAVGDTRGALVDHSGKYRIDPAIRAEMEQMLRATVNEGTGQAARLSIPNFGKTGTSQQNRNAVFVGWAGGIVCGVWVYAEADDTDRTGLSGGKAPAQIWKSFMQRAVPGA
ncbi:transglycosylase domain-containing protein [Croceicoccus mobilis]|uniref:Penicillin-insensitive transglycosylase n=1 Tax=Croceicoccus mobilis TaxID=1703339 RepID=A0A916Z5M6_9SPHN|nr:transglycosylase domain-containing protein [Croceicoccus mobilis]GGD77577.1 hypothetical protein GCM10010990_29120 [Croceicoccus mobilis]